MLTEDSQWIVRLIRKYNNFETLSRLDISNLLYEVIDTANLHEDEKDTLWEMMRVD